MVKKILVGISNNDFIVWKPFLIQPCGFGVKFNCRNINIRNLVPLVTIAS